MLTGFEIRVLLHPPPACGENFKIQTLTASKMNIFRLIIFCLFFVGTILSAAPINFKNGEGRPSLLLEKEVWSSDNEISKILSQLTSAKTSAKFNLQGTLKTVHLKDQSLKQMKEDLKKFSDTIMAKLADGDPSLGQDGYNDLLHTGDAVDILLYLFSIGALQTQAYS